MRRSVSSSSKTSRSRWAKVTVCTTTRTLLQSRTVSQCPCSISAGFVVWTDTRSPVARRCVQQTAGGFPVRTALSLQASCNTLALGAWQGVVRSAGRRRGLPQGRLPHHAHEHPRRLRRRRRGRPHLPAGDHRGRLRLRGCPRGNRVAYGRPVPSFGFDRSGRAAAVRGAGPRETFRPSWRRAPCGCSGA